MKYRYENVTHVTLAVTCPRSIDRIIAILSIIIRLVIRLESIITSQTEEENCL